MLLHKKELKLREGQRRASHGDNLRRSRHFNVFFGNFNKQRGKVVQNTVETYRVLPYVLLQGSATLENT